MGRWGWRRWRIRRCWGRWMRRGRAWCFFGIEACVEGCWILPACMANIVWYGMVWHLRVVKSLRTAPLLIIIITPFKAAPHHRSPSPLLPTTTTTTKHANIEGHAVKTPSPTTRSIACGCLHTDIDLYVKLEYGRKRGGGRGRWICICVDRYGSGSGYRYRHRNTTRASGMNDGYARVSSQAKGVKSTYHNPRSVGHSHCTT
ncbi:hypothetical protein EJ05DRAFT_344674 [Pseudovirgaria hyperparasitica]|uniref:Uncharacterized protein n=1 Tax=Pseudovirgaria hyperparasitica TaxID=470096 RepID=A0A6A6WBH4_9PEZI|nr:uncharacterized protein EJ05DRAFT_344674 [Pseudovirgaria hyperparasitica]KAF2759394.1 hypothetical protein EJ05DRAFT_344674 [Pseudovirgaria hyperparasitica]